MAFYPEHRDVPIAEYLYRHEAEFAAGFLEDAGIPFRLQIDDAGGAEAFMNTARPARLWVRAEDVAKAREVLDIPLNAATTPDSTPEPGDGAAASLSGQERLVAGALGVLFLALGLGITPLVVSAGLSLVSIALALVFAAAAMFARTPGPVRLALRVLSGHVS